MQIIPLYVTQIIDQQEVTIVPVLLKTASGNYLVDCGYEESFDKLRAQLLQHGVDVSDLNAVIITHDDYDHVAGLKPLKQIHPTIQLYSSTLESDALCGKIKSERLVQAEMSLSSIPDDFRPWALQFIEKLKHVERFHINHLWEDGTIFENELLVVHTPGHTRGHISLFALHERLLISGDALVIENGLLKIANPQYTLNMKEALNSVEKIRQLKPRKIICYHGGIIDNNIDEQLHLILSQA